MFHFDAHSSTTWQWKATKNYTGLKSKEWSEPRNKIFIEVLPLHRRYIHLPARNTFAVNPSESKRQMLLKLWLYQYVYRIHVQTLRMQTYHPPLESNGRDSGFVKSALYVLETDDKSSFSMSGCVGPLEALV